MIQILKSKNLWDVDLSIFDLEARKVPWSKCDQRLGICFLELKILKDNCQNVELECFEILSGSLTVCMTSLPAFEAENQLTVALCEVTLLVRGGSVSLFELRAINIQMTMRSADNAKSLELSFHLIAF